MLRRFLTRLSGFFSLLCGNTLYVASPKAVKRLEEIAAMDNSEDTQVVVIRALALYEELVKQCRKNPGIAKVLLAKSDDSVVWEIVLDDNYQLPPWLRDMLQ